MSTDLSIIVGATLGGTAEALGGGKFANGAITGAFVVLFNHLGHPQQDNNETNQNQDGNETNHKREKIDFQESESKTVVQLLKAAKESEDGYIVLEDYFTNIPYNDNALIYNVASVPISFNGNQCFVTVQIGSVQPEPLWLPGIVKYRPVGGKEWGFVKGSPNFTWGALNEPYNGFDKIYNWIRN